jgi:hypothetical protein
MIMMTREKVNQFLKELNELCLKHKLYIDVGYGDGLEVIDTVTSKAYYDITCYDGYDGENLKFSGYREA